MFNSGILYGSLHPEQEKKYVTQFFPESYVC